MPRASILENALILALFSIAPTGCLRSEAPPPPAVTHEPSAATQPTPEPAAESPGPAIVYFVGEQLWRIEPDGTNPRPLGFEVSPTQDLGGAIGQGDSVPTISRDGRWLAYQDSLDLWIVELDAGEPSPRQITHMPPSVDNWIVAAEISYSTWSPDSSTLIVILRQPGYEEEDPLPLPAGTQYGFHVLKTSDLALVHAPHIEGWYGWTPDSKAMLDDNSIGVSNCELREYTVAPGPTKVLRTSNDPYGFAQLEVNGEWLTWNSSVNGSQILVAALAGGEAKPMSPIAGFADIQWPFVAPDGAHVIYQRKGVGMLSSGPKEADSIPLPAGAQVRWYDASRLLAVTREGLVMLDLDGDATPLDANGTALVRQ